MLTRVFNLKKYKAPRRANRNNLTEAEKYLWQHLKLKQINNLRFLRQYSVGCFILDFYCPEIKLGIEVDGGYHLETEQKIADEYKTEYVESLGITVLRFTNEEVLENTTAVIKKISHICSSLPLPLV